MLTGETECIDVCAPSAADAFPKTHVFLHAVANGLRNRADPSLPPVDLATDTTARTVQQWLQQVPDVRLVRKLQYGGNRLWGCVAKSEDVTRFGCGVCINSDVASVLEATNNAYLENCCKLLLSITLAHETVHWLTDLIWPDHRLERTPPGVGSVEGFSESGWALENSLSGGHIRVTWRSSAHEGDFNAVERVTLKTDPNIAQYLAALDSGVFLDLSKFDAITVKVPIPPHISTRGPRRLPDPQPMTRIGLGLVSLQPGEVAAWVGADREPYTSLMYYGAEDNWD
ncbi:hypothetical protein C8R44DRAFT_872554 [Mycena epipterygia]|nr:hypothetical protein C8R44DRAFT_872554 [Mycena epipterygia]